MTKKVLVAYSTNAGSTAEVADFIGRELGKSGTQVDVRQVTDVTDLSTYDAMLVAGPMITGWHSMAIKFIQENEEVLSQRPVAYYISCLNLTKINEQTVNGTPIFLDLLRAQAPKTEGKLSFKEKQGDPSAILGQILKKAPRVKPVSVAFGGGKLDYSKLKFFQKLFVRLIIRHEAGDFRNWDAVRAWAATLQTPLLEG
ncbi:MAG: flavodoxin domain-containing protein [Candidatus Promineifilaceae bacterium]